MEPDGRTPDPSRRSAAARTAILDAALQLVGETGYAKLTMEGIASRAGVGKQTIYRWWPSKGAVLLDALLTMSADAEGEVLALPDTGDLARDLKTVLVATVEEMSDPGMGEPMRALSAEMTYDDELAAAYQERIEEPLNLAKKARLLSAQEAGQLSRGVDLDVAVDLIWGPVVRRWLQRAPLTPEFAEAVVDTALDGLRGRS